MDSSGVQQRRGGGGMVSLSPSQTPRSTDKAAVRDLRSADSGSSTRHDKEKGVNVQVIVRCRPLSEEEMKVRAAPVISCNESRREVTSVQSIANKQIDRTFQFDKVFGPSAKQKDLYDLAVSPIVYEVLEGYNCTIFAYGQTGTGKTYTMEGGARKKNGEFSVDAGVIPRAVEQIFKILEAQHAEYNMKVTFLELYNEEITDLLALEETPKFVDDKSKKPIALMEDGKGGVLVRGLEEEIVCTADEIYKILEKGSAKRRTAETLLNKQSSRSHSIFSITIHIKEVTPEGEEMIKCGKLNLVDLAGSENISRSGAREINQKMMKSAMIKDLYSEIDRLKQEVYAAREKNGIYIPRDRYLQEEAEKKAMAEKIEHMEMNSESKDKQLMELQDLYNSQLNLTADLSENLDKTKRKLEETEDSLSDLEEKHRQANATIKEKEFLIYNLLKSEKALVERAVELRAELESAALDVSSLFSKIERKDKIEDGNRVLVQKFQSQLTQQLEILHKTVASSVTQQEAQLKDMEEDMHSFVSTKAEATEELRGRVGKLKIMYGSRIKALDDMAEQLEGNSQSTFSNLNSEVSKHSHALEDLFHGISSEADALLNDLQSSLHKQEEKLTAYAQQQREAHSRAVETARSVSKITVNFFNTLDSHASSLNHIVEEAQSVNDKKLSDLEKKFEECAANEEKQLLEKVADLLATSNQRKKKLVQMAVHDLRESANSRTRKLQQEMSTMQDSTSTIKAEWTVHMDKTESNYREDTSAVENGKEDLESVLHNCLDMTQMGAQQWKNAQESLLHLEKTNVASVDSIVRGGMEANQALRTKFSSAVSAALEDADVANNDLLSSIDNALKLDRDACGNMNAMIGPCCEDLRELKGGHHHKVVEITDHAGKCLLEEYTVDEPSCSTPRKRGFNLPSIGSIEELRTPAFEELLRSFRSAKQHHLQLSNGDINKNVAAAVGTGTYESANNNSPQSLRDSRVPLTAIN
ncbi:unnamed protein product [Linum tenue]|uniref:Kinesin-like protein n=1 Tax=Linum tenue TaxID=586396 RepID=A0AAV0QJA1_9ROSI|nr:unnamed protein product [Linum tenue]